MGVSISLVNFIDAHVYTSITYGVALPLLICKCQGNNSTVYQLLTILNYHHTSLSRRHFHSMKEILHSIEYMSSEHLQKG